MKINSSINSKRCIFKRIEPETVLNKTINNLTCIDVFIKNQRTYATCLCLCGNKVDIKATRFIRGYNKSCGCLTTKIDLQGKKFGRLTVIYEAKERKERNHGVFWVCKCDCGNETEVSGSRLNKGITRSCGCLTREVMREARWKGHGRICGAFYGAIKHGANKRNIYFDISIEYLWDLFLKQNEKCALSGETITLYKGYQKNSTRQTASLDRIDSSKGYTEDNVQWVHKDINKMKQTRKISVNNDNKRA